MNILAEIKDAAKEVKGISSDLKSMGNSNLASSNKTDTTLKDKILDRDWAKSAFLIGDHELTDTTDIINRYWSSASAKFTDTRLGCNIGINPRPQFTRYSDVRVRGRLKGRNEVTVSSCTGNYGMGRYYSEAIDDPAHRIFMTFGVPQFNSIMSFVSKAFDPNQSSLARTGRGTSMFYDLGKAAGTVAALIAFPAISVPILAGKVVSSFFLRPTSKYYTLKPTMHTYWSTVNMLVNTVAINRGLVPKVLGEPKDIKLGRPMVVRPDNLKILHKLMPDVISEDGYFDIFASANKAQRIANKLFLEDFEMLNNSSASDFEGYLKREVSETHTTNILGKDQKPTLSAWLNRLSKLKFWVAEVEKLFTSTETDPRIDPENKEKGVHEDPGYFSELMSNLDAEFADGGRFATFIVDHTGSVSESFSNSVTESDISSKLNSTSSTSRQARFMLGDGNIMGDAVKAIAGAVTDVAAGALSGVTMGFSNIAGILSGSGYIDIPKHWQSSNASLPRSSYTMQLVSPYGNSMSQILNIDIPLFMILAGALPLSTGKQSYTSPYLCQIFDRGRCQIRTGMIESVSVTRGTANQSFNLKGNALAIDVTFSVADLSSIMHMPISAGQISIAGILGADQTLDEDNILSDYLAVLAAQDIYSQIYAAPKAQLTATKKLMSIKKFSSPAFAASVIHDAATSDLAKYLTLGATAVLEGVSRGSDIAAPAF